MKHKTKGRYVNFVPPDKYYLYEAHSVRDYSSACAGCLIRRCDSSEQVGRQKQPFLPTNFENLPEFSPSNE